MLEISKKLFSEFEINQISYCHFKSNEHLEEGLDGITDLDILVSKKDKNPSDVILLNLNFKQFSPINIGKYPGVVDWFGYDQDTGKLIHLHLHYQLVTGKGLLKDYVIPWADVFLDTAIKDKNTGVFIANPNVEYILLVTRMVVKRKFSENIKSFGNKLYIDNDIRIEFEYLKKRIDNDSLMKYLIEFFSNQYGSTIYDLVINIDRLTNRKYRKLRKIIRTFLKQDRRFCGIKASLISFNRKIIRKKNRKINKICNKMLPVRKRCIQPGLSIAFVGIDGSGKSTISTEIENWLGKEFDVKKFYAGSGDGNKNFFASFLLNGYKRIVEKKKGNSKKLQSTAIIKTKKISFKSRIRDLLGAKVYYKISKDNVKNIIKANKYCNEGCFCLMDRFPQNTIENDHDGKKVSKYLSRKPFKKVKRLAKKEDILFEKIDNFLPKFDYVFIMDVNPQVSIKRKPDHDYSEMERRAKTLHSIKFSTKNTIIVNANDELDDVIKFVKGSIWAAI